MMQWESQSRNRYNFTGLQAAWWREISQLCFATLEMTMASPDTQTVSLSDDETIRRKRADLSTEV